MNVGDTGPELVVEKVDRASFVRYAGAAGADTPIPWNEDFAKAAGSPGVFAQGMWTAGVLATFLTSWVGESNVRRYRTRFVGQVWPGEKLVCSGTVTSVSDGSAEIELSVTNGEGERKIVGDATIAAL
jgi:acyl dehydratase